MMKKRLCLLFVICFILFFRSYGSLASASGIADFLDLGLKEEPVSFRLQTEAVKLPQFDENRTRQLNGLLKHVGFQGFISEKDAEITVTLDDEALFSILSLEQKGRKQTILAPDQEHHYILQEETGAGIIPFSAGEAAEIEKNLNIYHSLDAVVSLLEKLPDAFPEKASRAKCTEKYRDYGSASYKIVLKLTEEEMNQYLQDSLDGLSENCRDQRFLNLHFSGRQGFTLVYTEDNHLIRVSYSGKAAWEAEEIREIRLEWKTVRKDGTARDELQLKTPNEKRTRRDNLILRFSRETGEDGTEQFTWRRETDQLENRVRTQAVFTAEFSNREGKLEGTIVHSGLDNSLKNVRETALELSSPKENSWSGTLEIISKKDKIETEHFRCLLELSAGASAQVSAIQPEPAAVDTKEFVHITENLYSEILRKLMKLPAEDLSFIREGIPDELWNAAVNQRDE